VQHFIATYGYLAVFVLMVAESACVPVPSELIMTLGGALAAGAVAGHHLSLPLVIVAGVAGNVMGSYLAWAVGRWGGPAALHRWGGKVWLREHDIEVAIRWFDRYGPRAVLIGRLLPVVRTFVSLPAGIAVWFIILRARRARRQSRMMLRSARRFIRNPAMCGNRGGQGDQKDRPRWLAVDAPQQH